MGKNAKVKRGVASLKMSCPAGTTGCNGKVTLLTKTIRIGAFRGALVLGSKSFKIDAGKSATVKVKLIKGASKLAKRKKLCVNARIVSNGMSDKTPKVTLKF